MVGNVSGEKYGILEIPFQKCRTSDLLQESQFLIVLDGFERLLRYYDLINIEDENNESFDEFNSNGRACIDRNIACFLRYLADGKAKSKILITTRLMIHDLEDQANNPLKYCYKSKLKSLNPDDAVTFMRLQGVTKGTPAEIRDACGYYDYHPLSLRLLSGLIARDKKHPGNINTASRHDVHTSLKARRHHILEVAYKSLPNDWQILLSKASAFRSSIIYDALLSISDEFSEENEFEEALDGLMDWGLLLFDKDNGRFDLHPIVRKYAYDRLSNKADVHTRLREYFVNVHPPNNIRNVNELLPLIELYYHTTQAGLYDEAYYIYKNKLSDDLFHKFGADLICIKLLRFLFPEGENHLPKLEKTNQGWTLNQLALNYQLSGQPHHAVSIWQVALPLASDLEEKNNISTGFHNLSKCQLQLGELKNSSCNLQKSLEYYEAFEKSLERNVYSKFKRHLLFDQAVIHDTLGVLLSYRGLFNEATRELNIANKCEEKRCSTSGLKKLTALMGTIYSHRAFRIMLMKPGDRQLKASFAASQKARKIAESLGGNLDKILSEWVAGLVQTKLASRDTNNRNKILSKAEINLKEAIDLCRRTSLVEQEANILLAWARWHYIRGDIEQAFQDTEEALYIADRCEYRLNQAEIHNFLAQLALSSKDTEGAKSHAEIAYERAWCDGPPYCYKPALEEAEATLRELGAEIPQIG